MMAEGGVFNQLVTKPLSGTESMILVCSGRAYYGGTPCPATTRKLTLLWLRTPQIQPSDMTYKYAADCTAWFATEAMQFPMDEIQQSKR